MSGSSPHISRLREDVTKSILKGRTPDEAAIAATALGDLVEQLETAQREQFNLGVALDATVARAERAEEQLEYVERERKECAIAYSLAAKERNDLKEQLETMDDALREILDLCVGWTRPMVDDDRKELIQRIATRAISNPAVNRPS